VVHDEVFAFVLRLASVQCLLKGQTVAVDATLLEAKAAMKAIQRKDTGDDRKADLRQLAAKAGVEVPTDEELGRFDQQRKDKKVSNAELALATDPDVRIAKLKDSTAHLGYKAEHLVELGSNLISAAEVYHADRTDSSTLLDSVASAQLNLVRAVSVTDIAEVVADGCCHKAKPSAVFASERLRTLILELQPAEEQVWTDNPAGCEAAYPGNRRRVHGARSKRPQRQRSEYVKRIFTHVCETGGARRIWLRGVRDVSKRYLIPVAGHNLGIFMRKLSGVRTTRNLQGAHTALAAWACRALYGAWEAYRHGPWALKHVLHLYAAPAYVPRLCGRKPGFFTGLLDISAALTDHSQIAQLAWSSTAQWVRIASQTPKVKQNPKKTSGMRCPCLLSLHEMRTPSKGPTPTTTAFSAVGRCCLLFFSIFTPLLT
jgi:hypothetical protein